MLTNQDFLNVILSSFNSFVDVGTSRSTAKLKPLHGAIARDVANKLGEEYAVKSQGYDDDKEGIINGRYIDKRVDITIVQKRTRKPIAGIAVKFVMQNYSQNSNNYFENMLGETANIRTAMCPYFQIFIILDKLPYYDNNGTIKKWEEFTNHNASKYSILSRDDVERYYHTPNKTLLCIVHISPNAQSINTRKEYMEFYRIREAQIEFADSTRIEVESGGAIIVNNYELFIDKLYHTILAQ